MPEKSPRPLPLLEAYETLTRKETVCLKEERFDDLKEVQLRKIPVLEALSAVETDGLDEDERSHFARRIGALRALEDTNAALLASKMEQNRMEYRRLSQDSVSAGKLRRAYLAPEQAAAEGGALEGRA